MPRGVGRVHIQRSAGRAGRSSPPVKRDRPIAKGELKTSAAAALAFFLFAWGVGLAAFTLPRSFLLFLLTYALTSGFYSIAFKRVAVLDVIVLAWLYTLRVLAGGEAVGLLVSAWLMAFSMFFFLGLACAKRYTELALVGESSQAPGLGRPYRPSDLMLFRTIGPTCGMLSVLVLALYINSTAVRVLYRHPRVLCPVLLYWVLRVWFLAFRGDADFDPLVSALRDRASYLVALVAALILYVAAG